MTDPVPDSPPVKRIDPLMLIAFLVALGFACWSAFGEHWPTTWLIEKQAVMFDGSYYVKLTFLATLLIYLLPLMGIVKLIRLLRKQR